MAKMLVETLAGDYDPDEFEDDYAKAIEAVVSAKLEGGEVKHTSAPEPSGGEVVDLLAALQKSVDAAKKGRGETAADAGEDTGDAEDDAKPAKKAASKKSASSASKKTPAKKAPAKKSTAKKTPAKKTPAKKSPAKKSAAKKTTRKAS